MRRKKIIALLCSITLCSVLTLSSVVNADQPTGTAGATQSGTPDKYVEVIATDNTISYGTLNISQQASDNSRTSGGTKYVIFDSQYDLGTPDSIVFNEGATNSNAFYKITYTGESYPLVGGLDNTSWLFLRDTSGTGYIQSQITGTLTNGGGGVTMPGGVTEVGSYSTSLIYYTTADAGATWTRNTKTIYVALGDNGRLYVGSAADLSTAEYVTAKGATVSTAFNGNNMALSTTFPTAVSDTVTFDFGYYVAWDSTQSNAVKTLYTLVDMPQHAATAHNWQWNLTITGEYQSNP